MTPHTSRTPRKPIAIILAVMLVTVLIYTTLVVTGIMDLALSLL
jgi:hypothetical protein